MKKLAIALALVAASTQLATLATADDHGGMQAPTPPKELADMAKGMSGSWSCTGSFYPDGKTKMAMTATMKSSLEMGGMWIHDTFDAKMGTMPFHFESYTTFSGGSFHRMMAESDGGMSAGDGKVTGTKLDYDLASHGAHGDGMFKDHVDWTDAKAIKTAGEMSMDKGKTWLKVYDQVCKKA